MCLVGFGAETAGHRDSRVTGAFLSLGSLAGDSSPDEDTTALVLGGVLLRSIVALDDVLA